MTSPLTTEQRLERLRVRVSELPFWRDRARVELSSWRFNGAPWSHGDPWPKLEGVSVIEHPVATVPEDWPLGETRLDLDLGGEGMLAISYTDGRKDGFGLDPYHQRYPLRDRSFSVAAEAVARLPLGVPNRAAHLKHAAMVWAEAAVEDLATRLALIAETAEALGEHEVVPLLLSAAEEALASLDWPTSTDVYLARSATTREMLSLWRAPDDLEAHPTGLTDAQRRIAVEVKGEFDARLDGIRRDYPQTGAVALTGHAHLDLAWLWPLDETKRKIRRTYSTAVELMERYPEFIFNQSTAQAYAYLQEDDPQLLERVKQKAASGQWEPLGAMWVEPDANLPSGESFVRQLLYGQRLFDELFGATHTVCWLPDCFGFSAGLPQILKGAGVDYFFTHKMNWSETNRFPHDLFWWEGLDGSRVLAHCFNNPGRGYNGDPGPGNTVPTWRNYRGKTVWPETLLAVGYGDGGGGTTEEMLEKARALARFPAVPRLRFTKVADFFDEMRATVPAADLPTWVGELYLEYHRGTYTTQGRTKHLHRRAERDLVAAEALASMVALAGGASPSSLEPAWRVLLRNQFHDILPGSSIREVYQTAEEELAEVVGVAGSAMEAALSELSRRLAEPGDRSGLMVVNPDVSARPLRVEAPHELPGGQAVDGGYVLSGTQTIPGLGARVVLEAAPQGALEVAPGHLENSFLRVTLDGDGTLESVYDKVAQREVLAGRGNQLWAYVDKPRSFDAWEVDAGYAQSGREITNVTSIAVQESGPHRAAIRIGRRFESSAITQDLRLWANSARLEFVTTLDWHDRHWLLKARWPLAIRSQRATFETAFGVVERSTHRNTSWDAAMFEVPAHRFVDLSEAGYGVALLNDGKYGHHAAGAELGITLLRSPVWPDPYADEGTQTFAYALYPHRGTWLEGGVLMEAEDLNRALLTSPVTAGAERSWQAAAIEGLPLGLGALKGCEDSDGLVLRVYEPQGASGRAAVRPPHGWSLGPELNLLEAPAAVDPDTSFTPFKLRSWRLDRSPVGG